MAKQIYKPKPKPLAIESKVVLSMLYQVKDRHEIKNWMTPQDIFEGHQMLFLKIEIACQDDYNLGVTSTNHIKAIELQLLGFNLKDIL